MQCIVTYDAGMYS